MEHYTIQRLENQERNNLVNYRETYHIEENLRTIFHMEKDKYTNKIRVECVQLSILKVFGHKL